MEAVAVKPWKALAFRRLASRYDPQGMPRNAFANVSIIDEAVEPCVMRDIGRWAKATLLRPRPHA